MNRLNVIWVILFGLLPMLLSSALRAESEPVAESEGLVETMAEAPTDAEPEAQPEEQSFEQIIEAFSESSFKTKEAAVVALSQLSDERILPTFESLLAGDVYFRKSDKVMVLTEKTEEGYLLTSLASGESLGEVGSRDVKKVVTNNKLRKQLRTQIATFKLSSKQPEVRLAAANELIKSPDEDFLAGLNGAIEQEENRKVEQALLAARAMILLDSDEALDRMQAAKDLKGFADKRVLAKVQTRLDDIKAGDYDEPNSLVVDELSAVLSGLKAKEVWYKFIEDLFFGVSLGSVLLLAAIGLAITFGVMGVINMAHGEMIMLGAYTTYIVQLLMPNAIGASIIVAIPAAFVVSGLMGIIIERVVIRHLYGRPLETLLATFGISLILQQLVRTFISAQNVPVITPDWLSGSWQINGLLSLTYNRLFIIVFALLVLFGLMMLLKRSFFGLQMRAVTQNRAMASSMGIRTGWVDALTFGLGSGIAGIAGVALSQLTNVGPNLGQSYIIDSFLVVVFGGVGNLWGTLVAAMGLGVANKFMEPLAGAVLAKILILIFIILFIQRRPRGLFALKGRFVEG